MSASSPLPATPAPSLDANTSSPAYAAHRGLPDSGIEPTPVVNPVLGAPSTGGRVSRWTWLAMGLAAAGLLASGLIWQKLDNMQESLARRSIESASQATEARTLARQAETLTRELAARLALQETRVSEVSLQRTQLEELMQSLSRSRDENLVVDVESALKLAQQQAQLTGSAEPLLAALRTAEQRLARAAQPRLNPLQRAITKDAERIRAASLTDVPVLLLKLDELARLADELPTANAVQSASAVRAQNASSEPASAAPDTPAFTADTATTSKANSADSNTWLAQLNPSLWLGHAAASVWDEARKLLRVSRIDQPDAALLAPEQAFFLRENFKLRLLNARLALLSRQTDTARTDLVYAQGWLTRYFDPSARKTQTAAQLLSQVQSQLKTSELPRLDETFAALSTAAAGR